MQLTREPSPHIVRVLDLTPAREQMIAYLKERGLWEEGAVLTTRYTHGIVEKDGKHYLIDTEGCGSMTHLEFEPFDIHWYKDVIEKDTTHIGVLPIGSTHFLDYADLLSVSAFEKDVPLHEFVRKFGARLEDNYCEWNSFLSYKVEQK